MIEAPSPVQSAIDSARALLAQLLANGWEEMHVTLGETEIFIAGDSAGPNPMRQASMRALPSEETIVVAPHVGTITFTGAIGAAVLKGEPVAQIRVLDAIVEILAPVTGRITVVHAPTYALAEFNTPLLSLLEFIE